MSIAVDEPAHYTRVSTRPLKVRKKLAEMNPGEEGIIDSCCGGDCCGGDRPHVSSHLYAELAERLQIMGICPGRRVRIIRKGNPMVIRVLETHLGVAADLAQDVFVLCES